MEKKKILIIDDEEGFTDLVKTTLEESGRYEVRAENQGERGHDSARMFHPDLILLDLVMPRMEGSAVAEQIKTDEGLKDIPIVFLTAAVTIEETQAQHGLIGGHPFLAKPVKLKELVACIEEALHYPG
ncbi:MAG: response regulator [Candidatus Makaraimicrobium thalassicum]|nr:MAG: response regulator [Candidatus Omnitrophota bacterium]